MTGRLLQTRAQVEPVLTWARTVAVLGAHHERFRPAFYVPDYLFKAGMQVIGVNPRLAGRTLWGQHVVPSLADLDAHLLPDGLDVLDVFRRVSALPDHLPEILAMPVRPKVVWLQQGIRDDDFASALLAEGFDVVQDRCMLADHREWRIAPARP